MEEVEEVEVEVEVEEEIPVAGDYEVNGGRTVYHTTRVR